MKTYLNNLNEREKWTLIAGGICLILYFYYIFLYAPLSTKVQQKTTQLHEKIETLAWMNKIQHEGHSSKSKKTVDNSQLLTLLATQLKDNETLKFPFQLQQTATGEIQLSFDAVPFKLFIEWLKKLNDEYAITIKQLDIDHTDTPGVTKLMVILSA